MAKYRIVRREQGQVDFQGGEHYWRELKKGQARDLDLQEIAELNRLPERPEPAPSGWTARVFQGLLILVMVLALFFFLSGNGLPSFLSLHNLPDLSFLSRSGELGKNEALAALKQAVVSVEGAAASGSGFNLRPEGLIVTNRHVVENNTGIVVVFANGKRFPVRNWQYVGDYDLAVASIKGSNLPYLTLSADTPAPGDSLIFIGNPLGFDWTISEAQMVQMVGSDEDSIIYFTGPVHPGSSGSPLFDSQGQVIGVIFASLRDVTDSGLAIPASLLLQYLEE